jgi:hypothetical protein
LQQFHEAATLDGLTMPPALENPQTDWAVNLRKENNSLHVLLQEQRGEGAY